MIPLSAMNAALLLGGAVYLSWLSWKVAAGISALISIFLIPWFVIAVWLVVASVIVFRAHVEEDATY